MAPYRYQKDRQDKHHLAVDPVARGKLLDREKTATARYADVRLERKQEVLDTYHATIHPKQKQSDVQKPGPEKVAPAKSKKRAKIER